MYLSHNASLVTTHVLQEMKNKGEKIAMLTAYDYTMAKILDQSNIDVILVGDIDRGGVFASVYGSIALQTPEDRALIKGIIINKFRGDMRLFDSGRRMLEDICGIPVLGVIPYYKDIHIEEEDSVSLEKKQRQLAEGKVNIAVVLLRHISNFHRLRHAGAQSSRQPFLYK